MRRPKLPLTLSDGGRRQVVDQQKRKRNPECETTSRLPCRSQRIILAARNELRWEGEKVKGDIERVKICWDTESPNVDIFPIIRNGLLDIQQGRDRMSPISKIKGRSRS